MANVVNMWPKYQKTLKTETYYNPHLVDKTGHWIWLPMHTFDVLLSDMKNTSALGLSKYLFHMMLNSPTIVDIACRRHS